MSGMVVTPSAVRRPMESLVGPMTTPPMTPPTIMTVTTAPFNTLSPAKPRSRAMLSSGAFITPLHTRRTPEGRSRRPSATRERERALQQRSDHPRCAAYTWWC
jgi:hypothetical protein